MSVTRQPALIPQGFGKLEVLLPRLINVTKNDSSLERCEIAGLFQFLAAIGAGGTQFRDETARVMPAIDIRQPIGNTLVFMPIRKNRADGLENELRWLGRVEGSVAPGLHFCALSRQHAVKLEYVFP